MLKIFLSFLFILIPALCYSHSQLIEIIPKNNVIYTKSPTEIKLKFRSEVKLVRADLNNISNKDKKIKLDLTSFKKRSKEFTIPIPSISLGKYNISWRALSPDGHIIKGRSKFEVK